MTSTRSQVCFLILAAATMLVSLSARADRPPAADRFVKADAVGANDGTSWADAYTSLQSALDAAGGATRIWVAKGTYRPSSYNGLAPGDPANERLKHFRLKADTALYGGLAGNEDVATLDLASRDFAANETILSGDLGAPGVMTDNCYHVLYHCHSDDPEFAEFDNLAAPLPRSAILDGFTIAYGYTDFEPEETSGPRAGDRCGSHYPPAEGGGMYNWHASPTIRHCVFRDNQANCSGGGLFNFTGSSPLVEDCLFANNAAVEVGGGAVNKEGSLATYLRTEFVGNEALSGGGMANLIGSQVAVTACEFRDNTARHYGGGFANWDCRPVFTSCLVAGNLARYKNGGAIANLVDAHPVLSNCTVTGNAVEDPLGGLGATMFNLDGSNPVCRNSVFWGNVADAEIINDASFAACLPDLAHCDIAGSGGSGPGWDASLGTDGGGNLDVDPRFRDAGNGDWRLAANSPCLDAGLNVSVTTACDLDGFPRIVDGDGDTTATVDLGCYEYQTALLTVVADPPVGGDPEPTPGAHVIGVGIPIPISLHALSPGYLFVDWEVSGPGEVAAPDEASTTLTVSAPSPVTLTANFAEAAALTLAVNPPGMGTTVPAAGVHTVAVGVPQAISATAITGWHFDHWSVDAGNASLGNALSAATVVTVADAGGATVVANFAINVYTVTFQTDGTAGASIDATTPQTVTHGGNATDAIALPPVGYDFLYWTLDGQAYSGSDLLQATNVTRDLDFVANFAPEGQTATLNLAATAGGSTSPVPGNYLVQLNRGVGIVASADPGCDFAGWQVTAGNASLGNPLAAATVVTVTDAGGATVTARFTRYARLTVLANPAEGGTVTPALPVTVVVGAPVDLSAIRNHGFGFLTWSVGDGDALIANPLSGDTVVTVTSANPATVFANFAQFDRLAVGSVFEVDAAACGLPGGFTAKPKVYGRYDHPFSGKVGLTAAAKVLDNPAAGGSPTLACEWVKKIRIYDAKAFKAAQKTGESAADWLGVPAHQQDLEQAIHVAGKEVPGGDAQLGHVLLAAPQVLTATVGAAEGVTLISLEGNWFGIKKPKVWREYEVDDGAGGVIVKQQMLKVLKPEDLDFLDSKNKPACMNAATGKSKAIAVIPAKLPKGTLNGILVLDNGVGLVTVEMP